ncbi:MAG: penicillin-binding transpeptidase domain-containing protein [Propionibacteriaceae bacterium]
MGGPRRVLLALVLLVAVLAGCSKGPSKPALNLPVADDTVAALTAALSALDLSSAPLASSPTAAQTELMTIVAGMDGIKPVVTSGAVTYDPANPAATVVLHYAWPMPSGPWTYDVTAPLVHNGQGWKLTWSPAVLMPQLNVTNRLVHTHTAAQRGAIVGANNQALVEQFKVVKVGIDKTRVAGDAAVAAARALATVVGIDPDKYAAQVTSASDKAFVVAITLRQGSVPAAVATIAGALGVEGTAMLPVTDGLAPEVLGVIGEATPDIISASKGAVLAGDQVGLTGLQRRYDAQLRGTPGDKVTIVGRRVADTSPSGSVTGSTSASTASTPRASASGSSSATAASATAAASVTPVVVYSTSPVRGKDLVLSLDIDWQQKAEAVMQGVGGAAAVAVIRPSTGGILAVANSPGNAGQPDATYGRYAPGSTFKIATSLALIRKGYTADTILNCTSSANVEGQRFKNYSDFPSSKVGRIPLKDAVAQSCNTAFINEYRTIAGPDLQAAAASLGVGIDYDAGFPVNYGIVPKPASSAQKAQEFIGQGGVLASPVTMAGLASSVAAGRTVVPYLVEETKPTSTAAPLTQGEAEILRQLMTYTVRTGSGRGLAGVAVGAKTGTAEYGTGPNLPTHAWMICFTANDLAVAVWLHDGSSGSGTAGPLIKQLLS